MTRAIFGMSSPRPSACTRLATVISSRGVPGPRPPLQVGVVAASFQRSTIAVSIDAGVASGPKS